MLYGADKGNGESEEDEEEEESDEQIRKEFDNLNVKFFLQTISEAIEDVHSFTAFVDITELNPPDPENSREKADLLAKAIWK